MIVPLLGVDTAFARQNHAPAGVRVWWREVVGVPAYEAGEYARCALN